MSASSATRGDKRYSQLFDAQSKSHTLSDLEGWNVVESHFRDFDDRMIKKLDDDVNTLLVFAGLFSAVLTAFIIESYQWLREDSEDTHTRILTQISMQLTSYRSAPPFINSTQSSVESSTPFSPTTDAIVINILWFLSLVLSLVAALYGMMVKQWMREYLQWITHSSSSQDVVYLRQVRFEAWDKWKVNWIIGAIPGLLEIALILFLVGMLYLLWTLNIVVAILLTVAVTGLVLLAFAATVLPAFIRRCPYKSPVGWACALLWGRLCRGITQRRNGVYSSFPDWRRRDMFDKASDVISLSEDTNEATPEDIKTSTLIRALDWAEHDSQNPALLTHINNCHDSLHWEWTAARLNEKLRKSLLELCCELGLNLPAVSGCLGEDYDFYNELGPQAHPLQSSVFQWQAPEATFWLDTSTDCTNLHSREHYVTTLVEDLRSYLSFLAERSAMINAPIQYVVGILCFLYRSDYGRFSNGQSTFWSMLIDFYNVIHHNEGIDTSYPGLRGFVFQLLCRMPKDQADHEEDAAIDLRESYVKLGQHPARIARKYFKSGLHNAEDRHIFVLTTDMAIQNATREYISQHPDIFTRLFSSMSEVLKVAIDMNWANCGAYIGLPWVESLLAKIKSQDASELVLLIPLTLLERLGETWSKGLVRGEATGVALQDLKTIWETHATRISHNAITAALLLYSSTLESASQKNLVKFVDSSDHAIANVWHGSLTDELVRHDLRNLFQSMSNILHFPVTQHSIQDQSILRARELLWINTICTKVKFAKYASLVSFMPATLLNNLQRVWEEAGSDETQWHFLQLRRIFIRTRRQDSTDTATDGFLSPISPTAWSAPTSPFSTSNPRRISWSQHSYTTPDGAAPYVPGRIRSISLSSAPSTKPPIRKSWPLSIAASQLTSGGTGTSKASRMLPKILTTIQEPPHSPTEDVGSGLSDSPATLSSAESGFATPDEPAGESFTFYDMNHNHKIHT